jgi:hypothetical protein
MSVHCLSPFFRFLFRASVLACSRRRAGGVTALVFSLHQGVYTPARPAKSYAARLPETSLKSRGRSIAENVE